MESPGEYLKRERDLRGISLKEIAEVTRVPLKFFAALEADNYDALPHTAFVKGYIKAYCKHLGLDENDAVLRYEIYLKDKAAEKAEAQRPAVRKPVKPAASPAAPQKQNVGRIAVLSSVIFLSFLLIYFVATREKAAVPVPEKVTEPAVQAETQEATAETLAGQAEPSASTGVEALPPDGVTASVPAPQAAVSNTEAPVQNVKQAETIKPAAEKKAEAVKTPEAAPAAAAPAAPALEKTHTLFADAKEVTWIKVRIDGEEPFDVLLRAGEKIEWKAAEGFSVLVGNAGGVELSYDGKALAPLGESGKVVSVKLPK